MFPLHTTEHVIAETEYRLRRRLPELPGGATTSVRGKILDAVDEIVEEFDTSVPYSGADPNDLHIHAAAVASGAHILLTHDSGSAETNDTPYEVFNCDDFFLLVDDSADWFVEREARNQLEYWKTAPAKKRKRLSHALIDAGCPQFAQRVEGHLRKLSGMPKA